MNGIIRAVTTSKPPERDVDAVHRVAEGDVAALAAGAALLGSGGGGDVDLGAQLLRHALAGGDTVPVVAATDLPAAGLVVHTGLAGAPDVMSERPPSQENFVRAVEAVASTLGSRPVAVGIIEIGGMNALTPFLAAHGMGLPVVDGDLMGRAFPHIDQTTLASAGEPMHPMALAGSAGETVIVTSCPAGMVERLMWANLEAMGGAATIAMYPTSADVLSKYGIPGSVGRCLWLGRQLASAAGSSIAELAGLIDAELLSEGRVDEVRPRHGTEPGSVTMTDRGSSKVVRVDFFDELLNVAVDGISVASTPDVLVAIDTARMAPLGANRLRQGQSLAVLRLESGTS